MMTVKGKWKWKKETGFEVDGRGKTWRPAFIQPNAPHGIHHSIHSFRGLKMLAVNGDSDMVESKEWSFVGR
jgi:hypothetical protein